VPSQYIAHDVWTSPVSPPILVDVKDKSRRMIRRDSWRQNRARLRHDRSNCDLIRFSEAMIAGEHVGAADR